MNKKINIIFNLLISEIKELLIEILKDNNKKVKKSQLYVHITCTES